MSEADGAAAGWAEKVRPQKGQTGASSGICLAHRGHLLVVVYVSLFLDSRVANSRWQMHASSTKAEMIESVYGAVDEDLLAITAASEYLRAACQPMPLQALQTAR